MQNKAKFLTITQAAQFLKVSPDTLRRWEEKGIITPQRTKGGIRKYTLLDLKIARLNKRKIRFFQLPTLLRQNYLSSSRDFKVALLTSSLWIFGLLIYHFLTPIFLTPTNPQRQILSDQLKQPDHLKIVSETTPIKTGSINVLIPDQTLIADKKISEVNLGSDILIQRFSNLPSLEYTDTPDQYYSLKPLPKIQIPTLIKRI